MGVPCFFFTGGAGSVRSNDYSYDLANNITGISDLLDGSRDRLFTFDSLNRLTLENYLGGDKSYAYDAVSNRTQDILTAPDLTQTTNNYTYESTSNRLIQRNSNTWNNWVLDAAGNTISADGGARKFSYNHAGRLKTYTKNGTKKGTYLYNALGQRVRTKKSNHNMLHYNLMGQYLGETDFSWRDYKIGSKTDYIYLENRPVAQVVTTYTNGSVNGRTVTYLHADHLDTPRVGTDANQNVVWRWDSDAFGMDAPVSVGASGVVVNLRFPGQIKGSEAPFYYNYFRDYDPGLGRYLESDPIGLAGGVNTFGYAMQNSLKYSDPLGLDVTMVCRTNNRGHPSIGGSPTRNSSFL